MVKLNEILLTLCSKADSDLSRTFKIVRFPKLGNGFIFNYFCKSSHGTPDRVLNAPPSNFTDIDVTSYYNTGH